MSNTTKKINHDFDLIAKTRADYDKIARHFSQTRAHPWAEFRFFRQFIKDGFNILDWGCGNGRFLHDCVGKKITYHGVDQSSELIALARDKFKKEIQSGRARFYNTARGDKKFLTDFFDAVFMIASFFHLPDSRSRLKVLRNIYREMKRGGALVIEVWNLGSDWARAKAQNDWKIIGARDFLIPWKNSQREVLCERYYHHFTPAGLGSLLRRAGFAVEMMDYLGKGGTWSDSKGGYNLIAVARKQ